MAVRQSTLFSSTLGFYVDVSFLRWPQAAMEATCAGDGIGPEVISV
jgi:hypothetical protein